MTLIGTGFISGQALDLSGLQGPVCALDIDKNPTDNCSPQSLLGSFGSAVAYTGHDNVFIAGNDRGPFDGRTDVDYPTRFHFLHIVLNVNGAFPNIRARLLDTRLFKAEANRTFIGSAYAFSDTNPLDTLRFDPEGIRVSPDGSFFVSDEYGPYIRKFNRQGRLIARLPVPDKFLLLAGPGHQSGDLSPDPANAASFELAPFYNMFGRQANRGMEGLAITPDGKKLVGVMQSALVQDHGLVTRLDSAGVPTGRLGVNNRILTLDLETNETHEYVYTLDGISQGRGLNEILAINDHEFLVLERDNRSFTLGPTSDPRNKRIYKIDLAQPGLTDVSILDSLPAAGGAALSALGIVPVQKKLFIDLLKDVYRVSSTQTIKDVIAEKPEALAWGPDLPDGRHVLYLLTDNDLVPEFPTQIYAFAIDAGAAGIDYQPQQLPEPLFPPGLVKQALK